MCEIFGLSSNKKTNITELLKEFFSHSVRHPDGWGMAFFDKEEPELIKEPLAAFKSHYLEDYLTRPVISKNMIAHIRQATRGKLEYENCHPFGQKDRFGKTWILQHNGTIFHYPLIDKYAECQKGATDSERLMLYIMDEIDKKQSALGRAMEPKEAFDLLDGLVVAISPGNKLNLMVHDGEFLYVHTNYMNSLYVHKDDHKGEKTCIFSTCPLNDSTWELLPFGVLLAYRDGEEVFRGTSHGNEYKDP